jgi:hypothetical protein
MIIDEKFLIEMETSGCKCDLLHNEKLRNIFKMYSEELKNYAEGKLYSGSDDMSEFLGNLEMYETQLREITEKKIESIRYNGD